MGANLKTGLRSVAYQRSGAPRFIELIGPAGAGKSSFAEALVQTCEQVETGTPPYFRKYADLPFFIKNSVKFLPVFTRLMLDSEQRNPTPRQIIWMITLQGWPQKINKEKPLSKEVTFLDQGPVFIMTDLYRFRCLNLQNKVIKKWWVEVIKNWARTLDMVVWLDSPNEILIERIRRRSKWHLMKNRNDADLAFFLEDYRNCFNRILSSLHLYNKNIRVIRFNTSRESMEGMVDRLLAELEINNNLESNQSPDGYNQPVLSYK
jgi:thymidylate kinase